MTKRLTKIFYSTVGVFVFLFLLLVVWGYFFAKNNGQESSITRKVVDFSGFFTNIAKKEDQKPTNTLPPPENKIETNTVPKIDGITERKFQAFGLESQSNRKQITEDTIRRAIPSANDLIGILNNAKIQEASIATSSQIEAFVVPPAYRTALEKSEEALITAGFINNEEKITDFNSIANIQHQQKRFVDFLVSKGDFKDLELRAKVYKSIEEDIPKIAANRSAYFKNLSQQERDKIIPPPKKDTWLTRLFDRVAPEKFFAVQQAQAQIYDYWDSYEYCYKHTGIASIGYSFQWYSCNSGLHVYYCGYSVCVDYYYDCGVGGRTPCNVPLGCLNLLCQSYFNSIYDWYGGSFKCGCG